MDENKQEQQENSPQQEPLQATPVQNPITPVVVTPTTTVSTTNEPTIQQSTQFSASIPQTEEKRRMSTGFVVFLTILGLLNVVTIFLPWAIGFYYSLEANAQPGTEFIALALFPVVITGFLVAAINVITFIILLRRYKPTKIARIIYIVLLVLSAAYVIMPGGYTAYQASETYRFIKNNDEQYEKSAQLERDAEQLVNTIDTTITTFGKSRDAFPFVNLDLNYDNYSLEEDAAARLYYDYSDTLMNTEIKMFKDLSAKGYARDGGDANMYYISRYSTSYSNGQIITWYVKDNERIAVIYKLAKVYDCPEGYECSNTPSNDPAAKIYPISGFKDAPVTGLEVRYSISPTNFATKYDAEYY